MGLLLALRQFAFFGGLFLDVWMFVAPYSNMTFDGIAGHRRLYFAVLRPLMSPFCGVTATDASILRCYGH